MMLLHPVILGIIWSLLIYTSSGQSQISNKESNKVYAYSYHFQHNGTTNSKEILRRVLGTDPEIGLNPTDDKSIVKTFFSPSIRGFFSKGILPAGPISQDYNSGFGFRSSFGPNSAIDGIRKVVESNLQPPNRNIANGLLPPISPDLTKEFPGDVNSVNNLHTPFQNQDDFPKIPPPPAPPLINTQDDFPKIPPPPSPPLINTQNDFPRFLSPPINNNNNNGVPRVQTFSRNTPDGGKIVGRIETFSYNSPVNNAVQNFQENSQSYRRNENILNNNQEVTGHRARTYFRQQFRTVTPSLDTNNNLNPNRINGRSNNHPNNINHNNNNNQWWNALNVLGGNNNNINNGPQLNQQINHNINEIKNNLNSNINRAFGARLSNFNRQNTQNELHNANRQRNFRGNAPNNNQSPNLQNNLPNNIGYQNTPNNFNRQNIPINNQPLNNYPNSNPVANNAPNNNYNRNFNDDTEKKVLNLIDNVNTRINNLHNNAGGQGIHNIGLTWDDDVSRNVQNDWSRRSNGRPFSNAHSGPLHNPTVSKPVEPVELLKTTLEALVGGRDFQIPSITGDQGGNYRNARGGGVEKFFGVDRVVEGPNSFSRNQQRGYERNFQVNSNNGYQSSNQWSSNTVRRLDAQSTKSDFNKDFIDVFREDY